MSAGETREPPIRVLLVEDNPDQADLVRLTLERQEPPFEVVIVRDGRECLEALDQAAYALILLDYSLPRMDGLEVMEQIRDRALSLPVVMVTAQGDERVAVAAMKAGAMDYIIKRGGYLTTLPTVVHKVLNQHALALENARLNEEVRRRLRDTEGLLAVAHAVGSSLDAVEIARRTAREVTHLLAADTSLFFRVDHTDHSCRVVAGYRVPPELRNPDWITSLADLPLSVIRATDARDGAVATGDPVPRAIAEILGSQPREPRSFLYVPVLGGGRLLGILLSCWWNDRRAFNDEDLRLTAGVATQMALALENSRLYEEAQRTLADLQTAQQELVRGATLRALGELASGAAHHLNNLLAVITGRVQLLLRTAEGPAIRQPLEMVNQAAADAAEVVRRVQRFARTQALEDRQPVDLNQVAREVVEMTRAQWQEEAQAHGISIDVALELSHVSFVLGNSAALREVATNLLINAVDAMPYGGRIVLRTFDDDGDVCLVVSDEGVGMPPAVRERALEPFFTTKGIRSTGLGLSVNYGIVRGHGGEMRIDSVEGQGTTIIIRLPRQISQPAAAATVSDSEGEASTAVSRLRILVIDDDEPVRGLMADILMAQGNEVAEAASGADGLRLLEAEPSIDLVLTDLGMPKMSGWEVARAIKSRWPWIPVGVVTGWGEEPLGIIQHGHLVTGILTKPVTVDSMQAFVATAMRGADAAADPRPLGDR